MFVFLLKSQFVNYCLRGNISINKVKHHHLKKWINLFQNCQSSTNSFNFASKYYNWPPSTNRSLIRHIHSTIRHQLSNSSFQRIKPSTHLINSAQNSVGNSVEFVLQVRKRVLNVSFELFRGLRVSVHILKGELVVFFVNDFAVIAFKVDKPSCVKN